MKPHEIHEFYALAHQSLRKLSPIGNKSFPFPIFSEFVVSEDSRRVISNLKHVNNIEDFARTIIDKIFQETSLADLFLDYCAFMENMRNICEFYSVHDITYQSFDHVLLVHI
jgi:hypothetical protein